MKDWEPFGALIDAHITQKPQLLVTLSPSKAVRHLFLPNESTGKVVKGVSDIQNLKQGILI